MGPADPLRSQTQRPEDSLAGNIRMEESDRCEENLVVYFQCDYNRLCFKQQHCPDLLVHQ